MTCPGAPTRDVFSVVAAHAAARPDAPALSGQGRRWTYGQLVEAAERVAGAISRIAPGSGRVAVVAHNHALTCLVYLAAARAGLTVSLVNAFFGARELSDVLDRLAPEILVFDPAHRDSLEAALELIARKPVLATLETEHDRHLPSVEDWAMEPPFAGGLPETGEVLDISWTSGTTSASKGVVLTHEIVLARACCEAALFELDHRDAAAVVTPLFHQSGIRNTVLLMWVCGGHAVVLPRFDARTFWEDMVRHCVTYLCLVETMLLLLEREPPREAERDNTLRNVLANGRPEVILRCEERFGIRVVQVWGMTETGVSTGVPLSVAPERAQTLRDWGRGANLAGWPVSPDTRIRLVADGAEVTGEGATGEIRIASPLLFSHYLDQPEATAAAFDGEWMKSGDQGRLGPDGVLYFVDRLKDVIRRGGENIASKEIEEVLALHPAVRQVAVVPVADPLMMQEVKAVIVPGDPAEADELWAWCAERLARYKVPRYLEFREALPVNGSGRVQKHLLTGQGDGTARVFDRRAAEAAK